MEVAVEGSMEVSTEVSVEFHDFLWFTVAHENSVAFHGNSMENRGCPWRSTGGFALWSSMAQKSEARRCTFVSLRKLILT